MLKDVALLANDVGAHGSIGGTETIIGAGSTAAMYGIAYMLGSPARIASTTAFMRAYRQLTLQQPTPARIAAFKIATRNFANTLGLPVDRVAGLITNRLGRPEEPDANAKGQSAPAH